MDRVVIAIDDLIRGGAIHEPVIIQAAAFGVVPQLAIAAPVVSYSQLQTWIREARVVVCHGGPGTILEVLAAGKVPRVIPRDPRYHEHVDGHQQAFARWLASRRPIIPVWDMADLGNAIEATPPDAPFDNQVARDPSARLVELVESSKRR